MATKTTTFPKTLPPKEAVFKVKVKGSTSQDMFEGDFTVRIPTVRDMSQIGVEMAKLNGGVISEQLDSNTYNLNNALSFLRVLIKDCPSWFSDSEEEGGINYGLDTLDYNVPIEIFKIANKKVDEWYKVLRSEPKKEEKSEE